MPIVESLATLARSARDKELAALNARRFDLETRLGRRISPPNLSPARLKSEIAKLEAAPAASAPVVASVAASAAPKVQEISTARLVGVVRAALNVDVSCAHDPRSKALHALSFHGISVPGVPEPKHAVHRTGIDRAIQSQQQQRADEYLAKN
jgi:hypothetical protein